MRYRRILFIASPVGPLGSGQGGGVEANILNLTPFLAEKGHTVGIIAARGSKHPDGVTLYEVDGVLPPYAMRAERHDQPVVQVNGLLENLWQKAADIQKDYDIIVGINYDWLAYYLTPFFQTPIAHLISISSTIDAVDSMIEKRYQEVPSHFAVNTKTQAKTFPFLQTETISKLYGGVNQDRYSFNPKPENRLCWVGRISPEKHLEDAFAIARILHMPLSVCGTVQVQRYWEHIKKTYTDVLYTYHGFLSQADLAHVIGSSSVLLMTSKKPYIEAFGNVCIEAMSCGTPVVAYTGEGPAEIVKDGVSGFLVKTNTVANFAKAVQKTQQLDRKIVRSESDQFTIEKMAERYLAWFETVLAKEETK